MEQTQNPNAQGTAEQRIVLSAMKLLYSDKGTVGRVVQMVEQAETPAEGVAMATLTVLKNLFDRAKGDGKTLVPGAAKHVAVEVARIAFEAGVIPDDDLKVVQEALAVIQQEAQQPPEQTGQGQQPPPQEQQAPQQAGIVASQMRGAP